MISLIKKEYWSYYRIGVRGLREMLEKPYYKGGKNCIIGGRKNRIVGSRKNRITSGKKNQIASNKKDSFINDGKNHIIS